MPFSRLPRAANRLACFPVRPNRRQTAEKLNLDDAFSRPPRCQQTCQFCRRRNRRQTAEQFHLHDAPLPSAVHRQPPRQFCRKAKQEADGRAITSARCTAPVCRAANKLASFATGETGGRRPNNYICTMPFSRLPRLLLCKLQSLKETLHIRQSLWILLNPVQSFNSVFVSYMRCKLPSSAQLLRRLAKIAFAIFLPMCKSTQ